jgi:hypothetical protein
MSKVKSYEINWNISNPKRSGVIIHDKKNYYLGIDSASGDITDFGGRVIYSYEDAISGAIREFEEETLFTFPKIEWTDIFYNSEVLVDDDLVIFLVEVNYDVQKYITEFTKRKEQLLYVEISDIFVIPKEDLGKSEELGKNEEREKDPRRYKIYPLIYNCIKLII